MSWLNDFKKQKDEERRADQEYERELEQQRRDSLKDVESKIALFRKLTPMVLRLLREVGKAQWGGSLLFPNYATQIYNVAEDYPRRDPYPQFSYWWIVGKKGFRGTVGTIHWSVSLVGGYGDGYNFLVKSYGSEGSDTNRSTKDTSENELKRILRLAVQDGPRNKNLESFLK